MVFSAFARGCLARKHRRSPCSESGLVIGSLMTLEDTERGCHRGVRGVTEKLERIGSGAARAVMPALAVAWLAGCGSTQTVVKTVTAGATSTTTPQTATVPETVAGTQTATGSASQAKAGDTLELKGSGG